jgi:CO/xanthine dehydrogenase FAD-binding subunit
MTGYVIPGTVKEALALLSTHDGRALVIAGGTDVLPDLHRGTKNVSCLVDITRIPELVGIAVQGSYVQVGAATTFAMLHQHPFIQQYVPALADAASSVGAIGIQTAATWAGNIVQAMPAADGAIVAIALDAEAQIVDERGATWAPVASLFLGPGRSAVDPSRQLITRIRFPVPQAGWGTAWRRVGRRASLVLPILNCAVKLVLDGGRIQAVAVALGPVALKPFRARHTEAFLAGKPPLEQVLDEAGRIAREEANPRSSIMRASRAYRLAIIPALVGEALQQALVRANGDGG